MIISSATPHRIIEWFQSADHGQELLCIVLASSRSDRETLTSLIRNFYDMDAALGSRVAFLVLHPHATHTIGLHRGFGSVAVLAGEAYALRDADIFRDMSDEADLRQQLLMVSTIGTKAPVNVRRNGASRRRLMFGI